MKISSINNFEKDYQEERRNIADYATANASGNTTRKDAARLAHEELQKKIMAKGPIYSRLFREYTISRDSGNDRLDLSDIVWEKDVKKMVKCMAENGIEEFTFSSTWSGAVETAWLLQQNGCKALGMVEINSQYKKILKDEHEKAHAWLFIIY